MHVQGFRAGYHARLFSIPERGLAGKDSVVGQNNERRRAPEFYSAQCYGGEHAVVGLFQTLLQTAHDNDLNIFPTIMNLP